VEINLKEEGGKQPQVVVNNAATLVYLANQAMVTAHAWLSKADKLDYPDKMIFDLDPPDGNFGVVRDAALSLRSLLESIHLAPFVKTTGSRGLHVVVPIDRRADFQTVREFSRDVAEILARRQPNRLTTELNKEERNGRLFIDYLRNSYAQTAVAPYSLRAIANAPVSTPLEWDELSDPRLNAQRYNLQNIFRRLGQKKDPWEKMMQKAGSLVSARRHLDTLIRQA
jgi:bifunctional non-homologous end joining protein LigD